MPGNTFIAKSDAKRYTLGIVYEPDVPDTEGDFMELGEIEKSAWAYMKRLQKGEARLGDMHAVWNPELGDIVACFTAPGDMVVKGQLVTEGTWLLGVVWSESEWDAIQKGQRTGFSMGGKGRRVPV